MDRLTNYMGQVPLETDLLKTNQNAMVALAKLAAGVYGTATLVNGFTVTPTTPASLNVLLTAGEIYQLANLEATTWSSLAADTAHSVLKQGILLDAATLGITPPGTVGFSQVFLVEVQYQDSDTGSIVLPYYNAANPAQPFSGPGNAGTAQNTVRKGIVAYQVKAGVAAATGSQTTPAADAGWTGLYAITVANGATTITSGNIVRLASAPFLASNGYLPQIPVGVQQQSWTYAVDTSAVANTITVAPSPALSAYIAGTTLLVKIANTVTGAAVINANGLGTKSVTRADGSALQSNDLLAGEVVALSYDGTQFQVQNYNPVLSPARIYEVFTTSTSWTVPTGVFGIYYTICGAGGGGSGANTTTSVSGGGGGGAGSVEGYQNVLPGQVVTITIGAGGAGGAGGTTGGQGGGGGTTTISVASSFTVNAAGGQGGGVGGSGGGGLGGSGSGGTTNSYGASGGSGSPGAQLASGLPFVWGGTGGGSRFGNGGQSNSGSAGGVGQAPGSGGGGGYLSSTPTAQAGGAGANGVVIFRHA